jgi:cell division protein FtsI (penicillin-binding protein 3)
VQSASSAKSQTLHSEEDAPPAAHPTPNETRLVSNPQSTPSQVTISDGRKLAVPSLIGLPVRKVIEAAAAAGLDVQITGSGIARTQAPAPGAQVRPGTKIVVHCQR